MSIHVPRRGSKRSWAKLWLLFGLAVLASAAHAAITRASDALPFHSVDLGAAIPHQLAKAERRSGLPVLVPPSIPIRFQTLHANAVGSKGDYEISLSPVADCGSATACLAGSFEGSSTAMPAGPRRVRLHGAIPARFKPRTCGGSCSAPTISFQLNDITYTLSLGDLPGKSDRKALAHLANTIIDGVSD